MEDELEAMLEQPNAGDAFKEAAGERRLFNQRMNDMKATPETTQDPEALRRAGYVFNGYGWSKP